MQFYLTVVWFHLKLCTKKDVDCFGQLRERKIWLAYVRLLSLPFAFFTIFVSNLAHAYNFTVILKPLNNFFKKLDNPEINHQLTYPQGFKDIENKEGNGASNVTKFFPSDFVFSSERPHYSLALFSSFIFTCTTLAKKLICNQKDPSITSRSYWGVFVPMKIRWMITCIAERKQNAKSIA